MGSYIFFQHDPRPGEEYFTPVKKSSVKDVFRPDKEQLTERERCTEHRVKFDGSDRKFTVCYFAQVNI